MYYFNVLLVIKVFETNISHKKSPPEMQFTRNWVMLPSSDHLVVAIPQLSKKKKKIKKLKMLEAGPVASG